MWSQRLRLKMNLVFSDVDTVKPTLDEVQAACSTSRADASCDFTCSVSFSPSLPSPHLPFLPLPLTPFSILSVTYMYLPYRVSGSTLTADFIRDPTSSTDCFRRLLKTYLFARY